MSYFFYVSSTFSSIALNLFIALIWRLLYYKYCPAKSVFIKEALQDTLWKKVLLLWEIEYIYVY